MPEAPQAVVFDVNVYLNAILGKDSKWPFLDSVPPASDNPDADCLSVAFDAEEFSLFVSPHILRNIRRLLELAGVSAATAQDWLEAVVDIVETTGGAVLDPDRAVCDVADYEDKLILDHAVATDAMLIVSNDSDLTELSPWRGRLPILRPREFIARVVQMRRMR